MTLRLNWSTETNSRQSFADDQMCILNLLSETELELNARANDDTQQVYIYLLKENAKKCSNSLYLG